MLMRPGSTVPGDVGSSSNSIWSMPRSHPNAYSSSVARPIRTTKHASSRPATRTGPSPSRRRTSMSDAPTRTNATAVFGFMLDQFGERLFRRVTSVAQPSLCQFLRFTVLTLNSRPRFFVAPTFCNTEV